MKRLLLVLLLLLAPSVARAGGWAYVEYSPGYFLRTNGVGNDGSVYVRTYNYCGQYSYAYYSALPTSTSTTTVYAPSYSADWKSQMTTAISAANDSEFYLEALQASGLTTRAAAQAQQGYMTGTAGYQSISVASQGYAAIGGYQVGAIPAQIPLDSGTALNNLNRSIDRVQDASSTGYALVGNLVGQTADAQAKLAQFRAISDANTAAYLAMNTRQDVNQTTVPGTQSSSTTITTPAQPQAERTEAPANNLVLHQLNGGAIWESRCSSCHSPGGSGPDFSSKFLLSGDDKFAFGQKVALRIKAAAERRRCRRAATLWPRTIRRI